MDIRVEDDKPESARNVLGEPMDLCCEKPLTGFYRNGRCDTGRDDHGVHTVCIRATSEFLEYSSSVGRLIFLCDLHNLELLQINWE
jgi:uncharacterized protein (DUF2237 family)